MFEYLRNHRQFVVRLGNYISHNIVTYKDTERKKVCRTAEELNSLDRYKLASDFYYMESTNIEGGYGSDMIDEIALYIDQRIPQTYEKWLLKMHDKGPANMNTDASKYGLIYKVDVNRNYPGYDNLNAPYKNLSDKVLYNMVCKDSKEAGYELIKSKESLNRFELLRLLHFFYRDISMDDLTNYLTYAD